jgi:hypothetical protein
VNLLLDTHVLCGGWPTRELSESAGFDPIEPRRQVSAASA